MNLLVRTRDAIFPKGSKRRELAKKIKRAKNDIKESLLEWYYDNPNEKDLVSVVIPIYDRTIELRESIESILNQSYKNIELILVCDGSPMETLNVVNDYIGIKNVRIFKYEDNSGNAVRGRNKAIMEARGKYLAFQDSDDIADKNRIKKSVQYMQRYNADIVYGGWEALIDGSREIDIKNGEKVYSPDCNLNMLLDNCIPCQSTVMAKVEALRDVGGLKDLMKYREDHELWLRMAYFGYKFKSIDAVLVKLRLHSNNLEIKFKNDDHYWKQLMLQEYKIKGKLKPTIAYVIPGCGISGGIAVICQHVNRLAARGYTVLLITEDDNDNISWFPNQNVDIVNIKNIPCCLDIVVATGWTTAYTVDKIVAKRKFYFVQSDESRFYDKNSKEYTMALDTYKMKFEFLTEAKWIQNWLMNNFHQNSNYIPNGLDEKIIYQTEPLVEKKDKFRVLLEGPIDIPFKGMEDAFNAVKGLDCEVWCISSSGRPKEGWKCDKFFEHVPMNEMKNIYSSCDIFLKMSRVEGFFGPPMEMMACGGVCVVGKVTGYDEYIKDEYNALVVEPGDVEGAREAVKRLLSNSDLRNKLRTNGIKTANEWKWDSSIDKLEMIYTKNRIVLLKYGEME